jgi:hypothetical protein
MTIEKRKVKNVFIIITHARQTKDGKENVVERCEFVDQIKNRHNTEATVILDFINKKIVKNRDGGDAKYQDFVWYLNKNYSKQMKQLDESFGESST